MDIEKIVGICIKIVSGCSIFLYLLLFFLICKEKNNLSQLVKIQLNITCFLHSVSYLFPNLKKIPAQFVLSVQVWKCLVNLAKSQ